jgi:hypothetical protein
VTFLDDLEETIIASVVVPTEEPEEPEVEEEAVLVGEDGEPVEGEAAEGEAGEAAGETPAEGGESSSDES